MATARFNSQDRQLVIDFLDKHFDAHFEPVASYRKLLTDRATGLTVLVFGSVGNWHGLGDTFMNVVSALSKTKGESYIILADKRHDRIDILSGPLETFVDEKDALLRNQDGDYQFHHERIGDKIILKENSSLELHLLDTITL